QAELAAVIARHTGGRVLPFHVPATPLRWAAALCEAACVPLGLEPPLHRRRVDFWTKSRALSIDKARRLLGHAPAVHLDAGERRPALGWGRRPYLDPASDRRRPGDLFREALHLRRGRRAPGEALRDARAALDPRAGPGRHALPGIRGDAALRGAPSRPGGH